MTCLFIVGIIGMTCAQAAPPAGADCVFEGGRTFCTTEAETLPLWASWYDPGLGGTNCGADCSTVATGPLEDWMFGAAAACPRGWTPGVTLATPFGRWRCVDHGTRIRPMFWEVYEPAGFRWRWVIVVDFMVRSPGPPWKYSVIESWSH